MARSIKPDVCTRLLAIDIVLSGRPIEDAAASARVLPNAVRSWLRLVARRGLAPTLARWERMDQSRRPQIDADPAALRELAANEKNWTRRTQMLALALIAEGMTPHAAAFKVGASYHMVLKRTRRFQQQGIAAFLDKNHCARARKLAPAQIQQVLAEISRRPDMDYGHLHEFVAARFGVRYSLRGLRLLLNRDLGIVWNNGRFTEVPTGKASLTGNDLAQHLNADELRTSLARTKDQRLKRKLIALIQLAQGWEPDRVALQVGTAPETLVNWVALYQRLGVHAFHPISQQAR